MTSVVQTAMTKTLEGMQPKQVFGEPIERDGVVMIPAATVRGGGGGGGDTEGNGGAGFGLTAKPMGMFILRGDRVVWQPALDLNRIILGGQIVAVVALLVIRSIFRRR